MPAKAGEISRETGTYCCNGCKQGVSVHNGTPIPDCPVCGDVNFQTGCRTFRNQPGYSRPFALRDLHMTSKSDPQRDRRLG
jgi:hypothetical protein